MNDTSANRPRKIFYGWWIVVANSIITFYAAGTFFYGFGAFINPLKQAFGWSTAQVALAFSIRSAETGPLAPLAGYLVDRFGVRVIIGFGVCITGIGFILLSQIDSLWAFYAAYMVIALGTSASMGVAPATNIANWFIKRRGQAMAFYTAAAGLSGLMVPLITWLLDWCDWRTVLLMMAIGMWLVGLPMALFLRHRPERYGMLPDGEDVTPENKMAISSKVVEGFTTRQALKERNLWLLSLTFMLSMAPLNAVGIFMIPYLTDSKDEQGLALVGGIAGAAVTIMTLSSLAGRFGFGWLGDRYDIRRILIWCFVMQSAGLVVLAFVQNLWHLIPFFILFAPSYGGLIVLRPVIFANYFGRRSLGAIQGLSMSMMTVGGVLTPLLIGSLRDSTGGYSVPFLVLAVVMLLAIPLILCTRRRPIAVTE